MISWLSAGWGLPKLRQIAGVHGGPLSVQAQLAERGYQSAVCLQVTVTGPPLIYANTNPVHLHALRAVLKDDDTHGSTGQ